MRGLRPSQLFFAFAAYGILVTAQSVEVDFHGGRSRTVQSLSSDLCMSPETELPASVPGFLTQFIRSPAEDQRKQVEARPLRSGLALQTIQVAIWQSYA